MTIFEGWMKACEEMNQQVILIEKGISKSGELLCLYNVITQLPAIPYCEHVLINIYEEHYILWFNYAKFQSFTDYRQALTTYYNRCKEYVFDDALWD